MEKVNIKEKDENLKSLDQDTMVGRLSDLKSKPLAKSDNKPAREAPPITCYSFANGSWSSKHFDNKDFIRVGKSPTAELLIKDSSLDDIHLALRYVENKWYVFDRGADDVVLFNGLRKGEAVIQQGEVLSVMLGSNPVVFSTVEETKKDQDEEAPVSAAGRKFSISSPIGSPSFPCDKTVLLGSNPLCGIRISDASEFAGVITEHNGQLYISSIGASNVSLDGMSLTASAEPFKNESKVSVDAFRMTVQLPENALEDVPAPILKAPLAILRIKKDGTAGQEIPLPEAGRAVSVGRAGKGNWLSIESSLISRQHSQLLIYEKCIQLLDCGSSNGTYLNGERINKKLAKPGDTLCFADKEFMLKYTS